LYSGRDKSRCGSDLDTSAQFSSLTSRKSNKSSVGGDTKRVNDKIDNATCHSHMSNKSGWSSASFDWQSGSQFIKNNNNNKVAETEMGGSSEKLWSHVTRDNVRVPPDGAPASLFTDNNNVNKTKQKSPEFKGSSDKKNTKSEIFDDNNDDDGLGNLRKLLKEGKIIGLNDKPPAFIPPSPPAKIATSGTNKTKPNNKKQKAPSPDGKNRKEKRLAPPPPAEEEIQAPPPSDLVQFLGGRRVHSVENICQDTSVTQDPRDDNLKRSTSIHGHDRKEYVGRAPAGKDSLAQLIADSTEKKFSFNSLFKGIWKKKQAQYSLDA